MTRDIHKECFDDSTLEKLKIFRDYTKEWLPVFISAKQIFWKKINIIDFFAGPGQDPCGNEGSPRLILKELSVYREKIHEQKLQVSVYLNEFKKDKYSKLSEYVNSIRSEFPNINIETSNLDFKVAYEVWEEHLADSSAATLVFFDQNGVKHMSPDVFKRIITFKRNDFLFFVSSAHARRFAESDGFRQNIKLSAEDIEKTPFYQVHRLIQDFYKSLIPKDLEFFLGSFSLRKANGNINGLIFGSSHVLGMEKFLKTAWKVDPERGEANYDIDEEGINPHRFDLFSGHIKPKKIESYEAELTNKLKNGTLRNNKDVYLFSLDNGILPSDTLKILHALELAGLIRPFRGKLSSDVCKKNVILTNIELY